MFPRRFNGPLSVLDEIGRLLIQRRVLAEPAVRRALARGATRASFLAAVREDGVSQTNLAAVLGEHLGMPGVDLSRTTIDLDVLDLVPRIVAESDLTLPLSTEGGRLHVAISAAAEDLRVLDEIHFITGLEISPYAAIPGPLENSIAAAYDAKDRGERFWHGSGLDTDSDSGVAVVTPTGPIAVSRQQRTDEVVVAKTLEIERVNDAVHLEVGDDDDIIEGEEVLHSTQVRVGPAKILVVDDDPDILRLLQRALTKTGYEVDTAADGRAAEEKLAKSVPDLLLLDAMLPFVHGFEICAHVKGSARLRALPVLMMSAVYRGWRFAQDARESFGADDYIEKPFHLPDLLQRVAHRLSEGPEAPAPERDAAEKLYQEGMGLLELHRPIDARRVLEQAVRKDPLSARAFYALARAMHAQGDLFHAITAYEKAVDLRPSLFRALRALAELYLEKGFRRKAVETLERALSAAPDAPTRESMRTKLIRLL